MGNETLQRLQEEALALSEADRAALALELVRSLDATTDVEASKVWDRELLRRLAQVKAGTAVVADRDELRERMKERLGRS
jgi:hypothetical protein